MIRSLLAIATLAALAACSGGSARPRVTPAPPVAAVDPAAIDAAFDLLMQGKEGDARKAIERLLKRDPMSANAQLLRASIEGDPRDLLGPANHPYTVRAGDTLVGLSQRLLGNRLKAYQLLRYNALRAPAALTPGQVLRIPGEPPRIDPPRAEPVRRADPSSPVASRSRPAPARPTVAAVPAAADPAAARAARAAGLAALNGGAVDRAVGLLRRAASLDPGNPLIARDRARAERIAATVRARQ